MSRYRPIAPKPETNSSSSMSDGSNNNNNNNSLSQKIKQSPYLRNLWPQLQARPTRTRKRGRNPIALLPPSSLIKRHKTTTTTTHHVLGFCPPTCHVTSHPTKNLISLQSFNLPSISQLPLPNNHGLGVLNCKLENIAATATTSTNPSLVTLPLLPCSPSSASPMCPPPPKFDLTNNNPCKEATIDLNLNTNIIPEEKDLLQQLQRPATTPSSTTTTTTAKNDNNNVIIVPQPIRPVGSCISVGCISEDPTLTTTSSMAQAQPLKRKEEVEEEVESEALPAVISDSNNRVRMANSAYKELVGQPECPWLESMVTSLQCGSSSCRRLRSKRISGEVTLQLCDSIGIPVSSNGFSCWVRIEWQSSEDQRKKNCVNAFCDVIKLCCESRDYLFSWRFHTRTREASQSSCNV